MTHTIRNRQKEHGAEGGWSPAALARLRDVLVAALLALLVATPLVIGDTPPGAAQLYPPVVLFMGWLLLPVGWAVVGLLSRQLSWRWQWIDTAVAALVSCTVLSGILMAQEGNPRAVINATWRWIVLGAAFLIMRQLLDRPLYRRAAVAAMLACAAMIATFGFHQYFYGMPQTRAAYEADPEEELERQGIDPTPGSRERELFENRLASSEPLATFALTNSLAGFLLPWLIVAAGILAIHWREPAMRPQVLAGLGLAILLTGGCLLLTQSRSAYLAALLGLGAVGLGAFGLRVNRKVVLGLTAAALVLLSVGGIAVLAGALQSELVSGAPKSVLYRFEYWQSTARMILDYPLFGCGPGNFQDFYTAYKLPQASETVADPHNFLLEVWATAGTLAAICLLGVIGLVAVRVSGGEPSEAEAASVVEVEKAAVVKQGKKRKDQPEPVVLPQPDVRVLLTGIALGPACGWFFGVCGGFAPATAALLWGWPVLGLVVWWLAGWIVGGRLPVWLPAVAAAAMLVNLLAAGGISFPNVAMSLWLLAALAVGGVTPVGRSVRKLAASGAALTFVSTAVLVAAYYFTAYKPPITSEGYLIQGILTFHELSQRPTGEAVDARAEAQRCLRAMEFFEQAAEADPFSPIPWQRLAGLSHNLAVQGSVAILQAKQAQTEGAQEGDAPSVAEAESPSAGGSSDSLTLSDLTVHWETAIHEQDQVIERDRSSANEYRLLGTWLLEADRTLDDRRHLDAALEAFEVAVVLYPTDSGIQAELAWAYHLAGQPEKAAEHAAEALRLDDLNPHADRELKRRDLFHQGYLPSESPLRLAPAEGNPREWMEALATPAAPDA